MTSLDYHLMMSLLVCLMTLHLNDVTITAIRRRRPNAVTHTELFPAGRYKRDSGNVDSRWSKSIIRVIDHVTESSCRALHALDVIDNSSFMRDSPRPTRWWSGRRRKLVLNREDSLKLELVGAVLKPEWPKIDTENRELKMQVIC